MGDVDDFAMLQQLIEEEEEEEEEDLEVQAAAGGALIIYGAEEACRLRAERRWNCRRYLTHPDLLRNPRVLTPWQALYQSRNNRAFITTMGFDVATFNSILVAGFEMRWNTNPIPRNNVPSSATPALARRSLDAAGALGLVLHFLGSTMLDVSLMQIFTLIPTTVTCYIDFSLTILRDTLREMRDARIKWLVGEEVRENNDRIRARHPLLEGAFGSMDGLNLAVQTSADQEIENATYNGWLSDHFVSSMLAFSAHGKAHYILVSNDPELTYACAIKGEIIGCNINAPGSWHDSRVARPLYKKLCTDTPKGFYLLTDTAFPCGTSQIHGHIKAPMKEGSCLPSDPYDRENVLAFDRQLLSFRQTAEWGNTTIKGSFGRLRLPLPINYEQQRADLLENCMRLTNLRGRKVGYNQIWTVYVPIWKANKEEEIWDHFEDMLFSDLWKNDRVEQFHLHAMYE
jgi:hypothetical protein